MINAKEFEFGANFDPKKEIDKAIVTAHEEIKSSEVLMWLNDNGVRKVVFTRGNISAIIGKAKSRKTFFNAMVAAAILRGELYDKFISKNINLKIVYFDTEQGRGRSQAVLRRIGRMIGETYTNITMLSLRPYSTEERLHIIETYMEDHSPDLIFLDGVRDLIVDFNNLTQATELMTNLMRWSEAHNSHICCVLHMNKADGNARGHLGSELMNKAESVMSVAKEGDYSTVEAQYMRDGDFESFQYEIIEGIPCICGQNFTPIQAKKEPEFNNNKYFEPNTNFETESPF